MDTSKVATRLREQVMRFSGEVSAGLGKVAQRFVGEMVYGIQAAQSVVLTEIGRTLEEKISIKKTEERLSRNLQRKEIENQLQANVLSMAKKRVGEETLLIIDPGDVSKKYAKKMEYLARVRDGSEKDLANGYWTLQVIGTTLDAPEILPLYGRLYSAKAPEFKGENDEILRAIDAVSGAVGQQGLWIMDRGGDRINLFEPILDRKLEFLFRLVGDRDLISGGRKVLARELAVRCPCPYSETIVKQQEGKEKVYTLSFGYREVGLPGRPERLYLLVIQGLGEKPLMLLTNRPLRRSRKVLWRLVRAYFRRWSIEDTIRFIKQSYDLENVRVLKYPGLQNLLPLLLAVMYFAAVVLDTPERLRIMASYVLKAAKRVFGIPDFKYYALADGLRSLFTRHPGRPRRQPRAPDPQILLFSLESS